MLPFLLGFLVHNMLQKDWELFKNNFFNGSKVLENIAIFENFKKYTYPYILIHNYGYSLLFHGDAPKAKIKKGIPFLRYLEMPKCLWNYQLCFVEITCNSIWSIRWPICPLPTPLPVFDTPAPSSYIFKNHCKGSPLCMAYQYLCSSLGCSDGACQHQRTSIWDAFWSGLILVQLDTGQTKSLYWS